MNFPTVNEIFERMIEIEFIDNDDPIIDNDLHDDFVSDVEE